MPPLLFYTDALENHATSPDARSTAGDVYEPPVAVTKNVVALTVQVVVEAVIVALALANT